jgi:hypothetical protein
MGASMALRRRGKYRYGDSQADIRAEIERYATANGYPVQHAADVACKTCRGRLFTLLVDEDQGAAARTCAACGDQVAIADSAEYLDDAELDQLACVCGAEALEVTVGVSLYAGSRDVRWLYLGCRCPGCRITGVYADWKNEHPDYRKLLRKV